MIRILITGSRTWTDKSAITTALLWAIGEHTELVVTGPDGPRMQWREVTVVHGAARGADTLAGRIAAAWGMRVEEHEVTALDWVTCRPGCDPYHRRLRRDGSEYCPTAANQRNTRMVALGADLCLGFPTGTGWSGTKDCMTKAVRAGIRVVDWPAEGATLSSERKVTGR